MNRGRTFEPTCLSVGRAWRRDHVQRSFSGVDGAGNSTSFQGRSSYASGIVNTRSDRSRLQLGVLIPYVRKRGGLTAFAVAFVVAGVGLELWVPQLLADFIDDALAGRPLDDLIRLGVLFLGAGVAHHVVHAASRYFGARIGWAVANDIRLDAAEHVVSLDLDYHTTTSPGVLIERIDGDVTAIARFFSHFAVEVLGGVLLLGGIFVIMFIESVVAGWVLLGFALVVGAVLIGTRSFAVAASEEERGVSAQLYGFIEERLAAIDDIRANGAGPFVMRRFRAVMRRWFHRGRRAWLKRSVIWVASIGLFSLGSLIALGTGAFLVFRDVITIGTAYLILNYMNKLERPIEEITNQMQELQKAAAGLNRLRTLFRRQPLVDRSGTAVLPAGALAIELDRVTFAYDNDDPVLEDLNLVITAGTHVGLLGRTGSGKTTITKLLARFYDPQAGSVRLGGVDLKTVAPASLDDRIAFVTQDVQLFDGSVKDNVTFFDDSVPDEAVERALAGIGLSDWIDGLPAGIHTRIGSSGHGISGGQAQLVAFARALLRDPGLVILDEPSSRVDPATEAVMSRAIDRLVEGRTAVIIAHRLDTVRHVDEIVILSNGVMIERGPREALEADDTSAFAAMLATARDGILVDDMEEVRL